MAAREHPQVDRVAGRYDTDTLELQVRLTDSADLAATLRAIQQRVVDALRTQGMPARTVDVTPDRPCDMNQRELPDMTSKHYAAALGFAFVAAWVAFGFGDAILCLVGAAIFYAVAAFRDGKLDLAELQERLGASRPQTTTARRGVRGSR